MQRSYTNWTVERDTDVLSISYACFEKGLHQLSVNELLKLHKLVNGQRYTKPFYNRILQSIVRELATRAQYAFMVHFVSFVAHYEARLDAASDASALSSMGYQIKYYEGQWGLLDPANRVVAYTTDRTIKFPGIGCL